MKIKKILEVRLDISNIKDIYSPNYTNTYFQILKDKYVNHCYQSIYILDILRIVRRHDQLCKSKVLDGYTYIDISFEVLGLIYEKGEVIHNCKIIQITNNGTMHAKSEYASIYIKNTESFGIFKEMDEIPVIVNMAQYNIMDTEVSISAVPFIPIINMPTIYKIIDTSADSEYIVPSFNYDDIKQLEKAICKISSSKQKVFKFFRDLIYPYKTHKTVSYGKKHIIDSINSLSNLKNNDLLYSPISYIDDNTYLIIDESNIGKITSEYPDIVTLNINKDDYILHVLTAYKNRLLQFIDFLQVYDTIEKIQDKSSIWKIYIMLKK